MRCVCNVGVYRGHRQCRTGLPVHQSGMGAKPSGVVAFTLGPHPVGLSFLAAAFADVGAQSERLVVQHDRDAVNKKKK